MIQSLLRFSWFVIHWIELSLFTLVMYTLTYVPGIGHSSFYFMLFQFWCRAFVRALGVDLRLHQKNIHALPDQYILVANHPSAFEDIGIPALFPVHSLAKIEVKDWWIVGRINYAAGTLYVDRESAESRKAAVDLMINTLKSGANIALYPEGGCTGRRITRDFKLGAFDASLQTGIPILPVFIHYEAQQDFEWQPPYTLVQKIWHFMRTQNNRANYYVYDAINPSEFKHKVDYAQYVRAEYIKWQQKYLE